MIKEMRAVTADSPPKKIARSSSSNDLDQQRPWGANPKAYGGAKVLAPTATPLQCKKCLVAFNGGEDCFTTREGARYHPKCFRCCECDVELRDNGGRQAAYYERDGQIFCPADFRIRYGQECVVCAAKLLIWHTRGGHAYCPHHDQQCLPACHSCNRLLPPIPPSPLTKSKSSPGLLPSMAQGGFMDAQKEVSRSRWFIRLDPCPEEELA